MMHNTNAGLEQVWDSNREHVRRVLVSLTRDLDLAEDLLQETYLNARSGMAGYRGGDARAWLSAIARNAFYSHARRQSVRMEMLGDIDQVAQSRSLNGSNEHITAIALHQALSDLSPILRTALMLKHYGGFSYEEIGVRVDCPAGTARRRVWDAIRKLRASLGPAMEAAEMRCEQVCAAKLIEFLYGGLSERETEAVGRHLDTCAGCRRDARQLKGLMTGLDSVEGDFKLTEIHDFDSHGLSTDYEWCTMVNDLGETMETTWWTWDRKSRILYAASDGEELRLEYSPYSISQYLVEAKLPRPMMPGDRHNAMYACRRTEGESAFQQIRPNRWLYNYGRTPNSAKEWIYVLAMRLPRGAKLAVATPEPTEVRTGDRETVVWRALLPRVEARDDGTCPWQFECSMEIDWETEAPLQSKPEPLPPPVPKDLLDLADRIYGLPYADAGENALSAFDEAQSRNMPYYRVWFDLGIKLFGSRCYTEALEAFRRSIDAPALPGFLHRNSIYLAHAWQGMMLDLLGRREDALKEYGEALSHPRPCCSNMQVYSLRVDQEFIEGRLNTPYERSDTGGR